MIGWVVLSPGRNGGEDEAGMASCLREREAERDCRAERERGQ